MWDFQLSNWLVSFLGSSATFVTVLVFGVLLYLTIHNVRRIKSRSASNTEYLVMAAQAIGFAILLISMFSWQSNAPKYELLPEDTAVLQNVNGELPEVNDLSQPNLTPEESTRRLEHLREQQKQATSSEGDN
jgi:heme/copper-type cytochrome/quinol oxidase subunit 2